MASSGGPSYRINLNRNKTQKWAEAKQVDYEGDEWGDDDYDDYDEPQPEPISAGPQRHPGWGQNVNSSQRSFTTPIPANQSGRPSFDHEEERRNFSAGRYDPDPQAQAPARWQQQQVGHDTSSRHSGDPSPLHVNTQTSRSFHPQAPGPGFRDQQSDSFGVPHSAPISRVGIPQYSNTKQPHTDSVRAESSRPGSGSASVISDSVSQTRQPQLQGLDQPIRPAPSPPRSDKGDPHATKALPFIRPADIYKRMEEEREKERRSQDSSRPSIDSMSDRPRSESTSSDNLATSGTTKAVNEELDPLRRRKPTLDTVVERRSEHGFEGSPTSANLSAGPSIRSLSEAKNSHRESQRPQATSRVTSSVYTDGPDPLSASSTGSSRFPPPIMAEKPVSSEDYREDLSRHLSENTGDPTSEHRSHAADQDLPNFDQGLPQHTQDTSIDNERQSSGYMTQAGGSTSLKADALRHQPSSGYRSVVQQAFDAENTNDLSPSTTNDTLPRSSSNSTLGISPIISTRQDGFSNLSALASSISEESHSAHDRTMSVDTVKAPEPSSRNELLPATTFNPNYQRNHSPPHTEDGAARRPLSVEIPHVTEAQQGVMSTVTSSDTRNDPVTQTSPLHLSQTKRSQSSLRKLDSRSETARTPLSHTDSEDWREWQAQSRQFNAKHGIQDSNTASPAMSFSISRSESPAKGTVKDIAEKLETNSGRSSPAIANTRDSHAAPTVGQTTSRKEHQRPSLPGGWMSDATTASTSDIPESSGAHEHHTSASINNRSDSTDSIPMATAPRGWPASRAGPTDSAFAAAAAAGSAMAGSFSGGAFSRAAPESSETSESTSEDEADHTKAHLHSPKVSDTHDFAIRSARQQHPFPHDPYSSSNLSSQQTDHSSSFGTSNHAADFPAPLRTNRAGDNKQPSPRLSVPPPVASSHVEQDPDQLQQEIVKSLTPKSSDIDKPVVSDTTTNMPSSVIQQDVSRPVSTISDDDVLPHEYSSYWNEPQTKAAPKEHLPQTQATSKTIITTRPPVPETTGVTGPSSETKRPLLEQRYSWEADTVEHSGPAQPSNQSANQILSDERPSTPLQTLKTPPSVISPPTPIIHKASADRLEGEVQSDALPTRNHVPSSVPALSFPASKADFRNILALPQSAQRIHGFNENRQILAQPSGLLENWISTMNTPDHADVFSSGRARPSSGQIQNPTSPRRDTANASGTKQMQEDGKRLLAAAGKYGGKAGTAAKGLFARGKDKLRTVSASDKASLTNDRRSSAIQNDRIYDTRTEPSVAPENAPKISVPALDTPTSESSWSTFSSKFDQIFSDRAQQSVGTPTGIHSSISPQPDKFSSSLIPPTSTQSHSRTTGDIAVNKPPASVVASIPGKDNTSPLPSFPQYGRGAEASAKTNTAEDLRSVGHRAEPVGHSLSKVSTEVEPPAGGAHNLALPRERRASSISDISDVSPEPDDKGEVPHRSVSPALEDQSRSTVARPMQFSHINKETEAMQDHSNNSEATLPVYSSARNSMNNKAQPRITPGTHILPVADLRNLDVADHSQAGSRPFSFFGSETLNHTNNSLPGSQISSLPPSQQVPGHINTYSDPMKEAQVNVTEHPAYRNSRDFEEISQAENPLPSSRRSQQELNQIRQHQQINIPPNQHPEEGYRIPGPYVQEYRSPRSSKPLQGPDPFQTQTSIPENSGETHMRSTGEPLINRDVAVDTAMSPSISSYSENDQRKPRSLGGLFSTKSRSPTRFQTRDTFENPAQSSGPGAEEAGRRRGFFNFNNRSGSPSRLTQDARNNTFQEQDQSRGRKLSMDMLRSSNVGARNQNEGKKKRMSGFGALLGSLAGKDRENNRLARNASAPLWTDSRQAHHNYAHPSGFASRPDPTYDGVADPRIVNPESISQFPQSPVAPGSQSESAYQETQGYYGVDQTGHGHIFKAIGGWEDSKENPEIFYTVPNHANSTLARALVQRSRSQEQRGVPPLMSPPVPTTRANRDISYGQDRKYVPPNPSQTEVETPAPNPNSRIADHVKNLHKRSRSPRMGRPPSDEFVPGDLHNNSGLSTTDRRISPDPVNQLGTFSSKRVSPQGGIPRSEQEQEKPWTIGLPAAVEEDRNVNEFQHPHNKAHGTTVGGFGATRPLGSGTVSPSTPRRGEHDGPLNEIISPIAALEPHDRTFSMANTNIPAGPILPGPVQAKDRNLYEEQSLVEDTRRQNSRRGPIENEIPVPPTISSANIISHPNPTSGHHQQEIIEVTQPAILREEIAEQPPQSSRSVKRALIEHTSSPTTISSPTASRPPTVAEQILGIQPSGRGKVPEHRSTTPVTRSPAPSIGGQPRSTTWPDPNVRTAGTTTTNTSGTTVTTTRMSSGKRGIGSIRTSTYVIDKPASRTNSNATKRSVDRSSVVAAGAGGVKSMNGSQKSTKKVAFSKAFDAVELPGSRPDGYESEEEIVMSATTYPGQEWMPEFAQGVTWDD